MGRLPHLNPLSKGFLAKIRNFKNLSRFSSTNSDGKFRVACASGFWGDTAVSTPQLVHGKPKPNFIVYDYLSEITMSLLARMKAVKPELGYCPDFVHFHMAPHLKTIKEKGIRIVSNAGGLNPIECAKMLSSVADKTGVKLNVAAVVGDDLSQTDVGSLIANAGSQIPDAVRNNPKLITSLNAYFGAQPISTALDLGADIVVTGRCVDAALTIGPLMHHFGWSFDPDNYDRIATAATAGHLIECGAQCTGGNFTDWKSVPDWHNIGFPIVEFDNSSHTAFTLTKPEGTGGLVSVGTVAEQLLYEIGDPARYELPDVTVDFRDVQIEQIAGRAHTAFIYGCGGAAPPATFKVTGTYAHGYRCTAVSPVIGGAQAVEKAEMTAMQILRRCRRMFQALGMDDFTRVHMQPLGAELSYGPQAMAEIFLNGKHSKTMSFDQPTTAACDAKSTSGASYASKSGGNVGTVNVNNTVTLNEIAWARSGDKGDTCNIGVIARNRDHFEHLKQVLTVEVVADYFGHLLADKSLVQRYDLPGVGGLNFVLPQSLGSGGVASLRPDPQGKAYAQMLLDMRVPGLGEN